MKSNNRVVWSRFLLIGGVFTALGGFALLLDRPHNVNIDDGLVPLQQTIDSNTPDSLTFLFRSQWSEPHYVGVDFGMSITDSSLLKVLDSLDQYLGSLVVKPKLDVSWRVLQNDNLVALGSGTSNYRGAIGSTRVLDTFQAVSGKTYLVEFKTGLGFREFKKTRPVFEVGVATAAPSVGLAFARDFGRYIERLIAYGFFVLALILLGLSLLLIRKRGAV